MTAPDQEDRVSEKRTAGSLTADDLGKWVQFWDAREMEPRSGTLASAHHHTASGSPSTWMRLRPFDGPYLVPADTPVQVTAQTDSEAVPDDRA